MKGGKGKRNLITVLSDPNGGDEAVVDADKVAEIHDSAIECFRMFDLNKARRQVFAIGFNEVMRCLEGATPPTWVICNSGCDCGTEVLNPIINKCQSMHVKCISLNIETRLLESFGIRKMICFACKSVPLDPSHRGSIDRIDLAISNALPASDDQTVYKSAKFDLVLPKKKKKKK